MNELKMGKWFKLPVDCSHIMDDTETPDSSDSIAIDGCVVLTDHHVEKVEIAINSYDSNQELIAKQAEQIELLELSVKEAVGMIGETSILSEECILVTLSARVAKAATAKG